MVPGRLARYARSGVLRTQKLRPPLLKTRIYQRLPCWSFGQVKISLVMLSLMSRIRLLLLRFTQFHISSPLQTWTDVQCEQVFLVTGWLVSRPGMSIADYWACISRINWFRDVSASRNVAHDKSSKRRRNAQKSKSLKGLLLSLFVVWSGQQIYCLTTHTQKKRKKKKELLEICVSSLKQLPLRHSL